jgi:predicted AAA+ superfamily ATPase
MAAWGKRDRAEVVYLEGYPCPSSRVCVSAHTRSTRSLAKAPRERRSGRSGTLFFWRDRTREVDFVVDAGGRLELYEAKWTEIPNEGDCSGLRVVRESVGRKRVERAAVLCRARHGYPLADGLEAAAAGDLA